MYQSDYWGSVPVLLTKKKVSFGFYFYMSQQ